jgi:hypothetical protein
MAGLMRIDPATISRGRELLFRREAVVVVSRMKRSAIRERFVQAFRRSWITLRSIQATNFA